MKKLSTDPKWVIYRQQVLFNEEKKQFEPNIRLSDKGREQLKFAIGYISRAVDIFHWNERRDQLKELVHPVIISTIDGLGLINKVLKPVKK